MRTFIFSFCLMITSGLSAQKIFYSLTDRNDARNLEYAIIGKHGSQYYVYKQIRNEHRITIYNKDMEAKEEVYLDFIPEKTISVETFKVSDGILIVYQYHKKNIAYCMRAKLDMQGKVVVMPSVMDTTAISLSNNKEVIYSSLISEDKKRLVVFKMKNNASASYDFKLWSFADSLSLPLISSFQYVVDSEKDIPSQFSVDNQGVFLFSTLLKSAQKDQVSKADICVFPSNGDSLFVNQVLLGKVFPDEMRLKVDNYNGRCLLTSFYSTSRRGNIEGLIYLNFDYSAMKTQHFKLFAFTDELKNIAKGDNSLQGAFNDYYLGEFMIRKDGGVVLLAESNYTNNRNTGFNRWDNPYNWGWGGRPGVSWGMSPFNNFGWGMPGGWNNFGVQSTRYFSENVVAFSLDKEGEIIWNNVMPKSQFEDNTDQLLSYQSVNTGKEILLLYNEWARRSPVLTMQSLSQDGQLSRHQPLRNMDKGYEFIIRNARQVGLREVIVPVLNRNSISFARIEF
jgi:hypothetical protein